MPRGPSRTPMQQYVDLTDAERRAVDVHKYFMSERYGYDVGFDTAYDDWSRHYSEDWRRRRHERMLSLEMSEIARHVWIVSQKNGRDMGREAALDWVLNYAAEWRTWFECEYEYKD
jgi:hypothetical protein